MEGVERASRLAALLVGSSGSHGGSSTSCEQECFRSLTPTVGGVVDSRMRATSVAVTLFIVNLLGYGLGPPVVGGLSTFLNSLFLSGNDLGMTLETCKAVGELAADAAATCASANSEGLRWAIIAACSLYAWAAVHYLLAGRTLMRDMMPKEL